MPIKQLEIKSKKIQFMKPVTGADYSEKTVLTKSAWEYVELWLRRKAGAKAKEALFFWEQAKNFYDASECLPVESKPLTSYYCCLNAAKALLAINGSSEINFKNISHGISSKRETWGNNNLKDAKVVFMGSGVLCELSKYFGEDSDKKAYNVYSLLYNIPCIHRTFSITYKCPELFIPIKDLSFIIDTDHKKGWLQFQVDERYANGYSLRYAPKCVEKVKFNTDSRYLMRFKKSFRWDIHDAVQVRKKNLSAYHGKVRRDLYYIYGDVRLWYLKKNITTSKYLLRRNSITLIFAVMHWLSELVRYNPEQFASLMHTKQNWLIHEFVDNALYQFVDEISCEITKVDIMTNGYRK